MVLSAAVGITCLRCMQLDSQSSKYDVISRLVLSPVTEQVAVFQAMVVCKLHIVSSANGVGGSHLATLPVTVGSCTFLGQGTSR